MSNWANVLTFTINWLPIVAFISHVPNYKLTMLVLWKLDQVSGI